MSNDSGVPGSGSSVGKAALVPGDTGAQIAIASLAVRIGFGHPELADSMMCWSAATLRRAGQIIQLNHHVHLGGEGVPDRR
jgi:hypothetical protein